MDTREKYERYVSTSFLHLEPLVVASADGAVILDDAGREYIDCYSGIAVVNAGHGHPAVRAAAKAQIDRLIHCQSYTYYVDVVADLAQRLAESTPGRLTKTFFSNSGAEAVECALRMARAYTGRHEVIALERSFHGRTLAALSLTGNANRKTHGGPYMPGVAFAPAPFPYRSRFGGDPDHVAEAAAAAVEDVVRYHTSGDVAAFIAEPVMGEGGIIVPPRRYFAAVKQVLDRYGILLIVDEVQTGFGRTGKLFAIEHYGVEPDILTLAKGMADGFPIGATVARAEIADSLRPGEHLSTFGGNPVSAAAALANLTVMQEEALPAQAAAKGEVLLRQLRELQSGVTQVGEVRGLGLMIGMELVRDRAGRQPFPELAVRIRERCRERGLLVGTAGTEGNVVRLQPPLVIDGEQLNQAVRVLTEVTASAAAQA